MSYSYVNPFVKKPKCHPHAALMRDYAEDAAKYAEPWKQWEVQLDCGIWAELTFNPGWHTIYRYRRKIKSNVN